MEEIPQIITDLAYILIAAGIVTILFKSLRQPLVLGYIVAGFLAGPNMSYMPSVTSVESISEWSEIGVIFLMFTLGLEFSFKKIMRMGMQPIITTLCVMFSMMSVGTAAGYLFGWNGMDRLFLGGMLAMSSTTIIYKAFDDLGLRSKRFATGVLSTLILEDILGILLMVMLSAVAVSKQFEGMQLFMSFLKLAFFLIFWFLIGIFLVPLCLRKFKRYINAETLLIVSVGMCFLLVVIAARMGYSPAFGAFMMGSILSETMESERIEHTMMPLRNLFGAIFFVSVGMLVDPQVLLDYWPAILGITLVVIFGQMIFGTLSFLISGASLQDAMRSGFSLVQIGEFAFIIAALGESLNVTSSFLYPVVVAVSIITTFFTPYIIKLADPAYTWLQKVFPQQLKSRISFRRHKGVTRNQKQTPTVAWKAWIGDVVMQTVAYLTLSLALSSFCLAFLLPLCTYGCGQMWGGVTCLVVSILLLSPCVRPIIMRKNHNKNALYLLQIGGVHRFMVYTVVALKALVGYYIIFYMVQMLSPLHTYFNFLVAFGVEVFIVWLRMVKYLSIKLERIFTQNLRFKEEHNAASDPRYGKPLRGRDIRIMAVTIPLHSLWSGKTLGKLRFSNVYVVAIERGEQRIDIPGPSNTIFSGDTLEVVGDDLSLETFRQAMNAEVKLEHELSNKEIQLTMQSFRLSDSSEFIGKSLVELSMRAKYNCLVIGIEDAEGNIHAAKPTRTFQQGDKFWAVAEPSNLALIQSCV